MLLLGRLPEHTVLLIDLTFGAVIRHEAAIVHLMLMVLMLGHGSLDIVREPATPAVSITSNALHSLLLREQVVIRMVLLGASYLVQNVCINVRCRVHRLGLGRHRGGHLILWLLVGQVLHLSG